jgi:hypothetical protein
LSQHLVNPVLIPVVEEGRLHLVVGSSLSRISRLEPFRQQRLCHRVHVEVVLAGQVFPGGYPLGIVGFAGVHIVQVLLEKFNRFGVFGGAFGIGQRVERVNAEYGPEISCTIMSRLAGSIWSQPLPASSP